jgi:hypothetical protein
MHQVKPDNPIKSAKIFMHPESSFRLDKGSLPVTFQKAVGHFHAIDGIIRHCKILNFFSPGFRQVILNYVDHLNDIPDILTRNKGLM